VWSKALKARVIKKPSPHGGAMDSARCFGACDGPGVLGEVGRVVQRQEGNGAGDGERLHGREKL
jgi:hypothetical protein